MAKGKLEVIEVVPTPTLAAGIIRAFGSKSYGVVTSLSDGYLGTLRAFLAEDSLVDLKPFGEFVRQVHSQCARTSPRLASTRQVLTAIALACDELESLGPFEKVRAFPGFHQCLREQLRTLQHWSVPKEGTEIAGPTGAKLESILAVQREVLATLTKANACFASDLMEACLDQTLDLDGQEARLLIFCRGELHPLGLRWLKWLVEQGAEVQVVLDRHARNAPIFRSSQVIKSILGVAAKQPGTANRLLNGLFSSEDASGVSLDLVEVHSAGDSFSEAEWALRRASELSEFGHVTIFARDSDTYLPVLIASGQRMRIPLRVSRRTPLQSNGFIKSVVHLLRLLESTDVRPLAPLLRSGYFGTGWTQEITAKIESAHAQGGDEWLTLDSLLTDEPEVGLLAHIRKARVEAHIAKSFIDWHAFLRNLVESAPWFTEVSQALGDGRDQRAFTSLLSALGQDAMVRHTGQPAEVSFSEWMRVFDVIVEKGDSSVPKQATGIDIATRVDEIGLTDYVIALGLIEGAFPRRRSEDPLLSDEDLSLIEGEVALPNSFDEAFAERDHFYRLCACPSRGLVLTYPQGDGERDNIPAFYLDEVKRVCEVGSEIAHPRRDLFPAAETCSNESDRLLSKANQSDPHPAPRNVLEVISNRDLIKFSRSTVRPGELRYLNECTFRFLATRGLPMPPRDGDFWGYLLRIPERANLLIATDSDAAALAMGAAFEEVLDAIKPLVPAWERDLLVYGSERMFSAWIQREFASRTLWGRDPLRTRLGGTLAQIGNHALYDDKLAGVTTDQGVRTLHLYRRRAPEKIEKHSGDSLFLEYGAMIETAWVDVHSVQVEVEGLGENRTLFTYLPEGDDPPPAGDGLSVINLGRGGATRSDLRVQLKGLYAEGLQRAKLADMTATPGDYCARCPVSDLCRRAQGASEEEDFFAKGSDVTS